MEYKMLLSKKQVDRAGDVLRNSLVDKTITTDDYNTALETLSQWRIRHLYPLKLAYNLAKKHTNQVGNNAFYGRRLKRAKSVIYKLNRMTDSKLSRMQDIGGCRVILSDVHRVNKLYELLLKSKTILKNHKNYIVNPKSDGYRSIHLIYQCNSPSKAEYNSLKIEIQLRTKLQHAWATALEIIDTFNHEKIKIGQGSTDWNRFFFLVAEEFARQENVPLKNAQGNNCEEILNLSASLGIIKKLRSYSIISTHLGNKELLNKYVVIWLQAEKGIIEICDFDNVETAQQQYLSLEQLNRDRYDEVVLVESDSIKELKKVFPNYFADSRFFVKNLMKILENK